MENQKKNPHVIIAGILALKEIILALINRRKKKKEEAAADSEKPTDVNQ